MKTPMHRESRRRTMGEHDRAAGLQWAKKDALQPHLKMFVTSITMYFNEDDFYLYFFVTQIQTQIVLEPVLNTTE